MINITFLQSAFLAGLAAIAVPIIIHLLSGRTRRRQYFSSLMLLREISVRRSRSIKFRRWLLLLLRILLLALISLIMARPMLNSSAGLRLEQDTSCANVLIVDTSMSMGMGEDTDTSFLGRAKNNMALLLKAFTPNDTITLISAGQTGAKLTVGPFSSDPVAAQQAIDDMKPDWGRADVKSALDMAVEILHSSSAGRKRIFVFSDLQQSSWNFRYDLPLDISAYAFERTRPVADNSSLLAGNVFSELIDMRDTLTLTAALKTTAGADDGDTQQGSLRILVGGREVEKRSLPRLSDGMRTETFQYLPERGAKDISGRFELGPDFFDMDNRRFFSISVPDSIRVLLVDPVAGPMEKDSSKDSFFIRQALAPQTGPARMGREGTQSLIRVETTDTDRLSSFDLSNFDLLVFSAMDKLPKDRLEAFASYIKTGGRAIIFLGGRTDTQALNNALTTRKSAFGYDIFSSTVGSVSLPDSDRNDDTFWGPYLESSPLFRDFDKYFDQTRVVFNKHYRFDTQEGGRDKILARYSDADAMILESTFGTGRCFLIGFAPVKEWTNFPLQPTFVTFIHRLVLYASGYLSWTPEQFHVGESMVIRNADLPKDNPPLTITASSGKSTPLEDYLYTDNTLSADFTFDAPGIYRLESGTAYSRTLAVNYDEAEIRETDFVPAEDLKTLWDGRITVLVADEEGFAEQLNISGGQRTGLAKFLALLLLMILLAETVLANRNNFAARPKTGK